MVLIRGRLESGRGDYSVVTLTGAAEQLSAKGPY